MYVDALTITALTAELREQILGGRVQEIVATGPLGLGLEVYANHRRRYLALRVDAQRPAVHLTDTHLRRGLECPTPLLLLLRKWAEGARLAGIEQPAWERVLRLEFDHPDWGVSRLLVEIMGKHSNIILIDAAGVIMDSLKRIGPEINRYRTVLPRQPYVPPPPQDKLPLDQITELRLREALEAGPSASAWRTLVQGFFGASPLLAREACFRAYGDAEIPAGQVARFAPLLHAVQDLIAPAGGTAPWEPSLALEAADEEGMGAGKEPAVHCFAPYELTHYPRRRGAPGISAAIEAWLHTEPVAQDAYGFARRRLQGIVDEALQKVRRRKSQLEEQYASLESLEELRIDGELILAYGWSLPPGQSELRVDLEDGSPPRRIRLDPALGPSENAQALFSRYGKGKRSREDIPPLLAQAELELEQLQQLTLDLELAANRQEIEDVRAGLIVGGYLKGKVPKRGKGQVAQPLRFEAPEGFAILVGRNSRQNDVLTFTLSQPDDLWLHARGLAGSHVIVRAAGRQIAPAAIQRAAELAAYYSAGRQDAKVEVVYTLRRHVRRQPDAAPGQVTYRQERALSVAPKG